MNPNRPDKTTLPAIQQSLYAWYDREQRHLPWRRANHPHATPYAIWISEAMLQQTQVKTMIPYFLRFMDRFPDIAALAAADRHTVYKAWEGLGYYSRARHLHEAARLIHETMDGQIPQDPQTLLSLPGIGPYISAAILSIAFGQPFAVVDGNVKRVLARLFRIETPPSQTASKAIFQSHADLLLDPRDPGRHNQAMMELGALVCTPRNPQCAQCPLPLFCQAFRDNVTHHYPIRAKRPPLPTRYWTAAAVIKGNRILLTQRPPTGLLAGLWEFPCAILSPGDDSPQSCAQATHRTTGLQTGHPCHITTVHHTYTHFKLRLDLFLLPFHKGRIRLNGPAAFKWVLPHQVKDLPLHKAIHKTLPAFFRHLEKSGLTPL